MTDADTMTDGGAQPRTLVRPLLGARGAVQRRQLSDCAHSSHLHSVGSAAAMGASGAVHLMLCVLTVSASLQAASAAGRGGRSLLQGGAAAPDASLPTFVSQVRRAASRRPRQNVPSREVMLALLGVLNVTKRQQACT